MVSLKAKKHKQHSEKFPRYIIITPSDTINDLRKPSPFLIEKFLNHNIGSLKNVKMLRSGHMLIECDSASHSNKLLNLSDLMISSQFNQIQTFCCFLWECSSQAIRYPSCSLLSHATPAVMGHLAHCWISTQDLRTRQHYLNRQIPLLPSSRIDSHFISDFQRARLL